MTAFSIKARRLIAIAASAGTVSALAACSSTGSADPSATTTAAAAECGTVSFLVNRIDIPWNATMADGAKEHASELGVTLNVLNGGNDNSNQIAQMQQAIANGVDGILLQAVEANGIVPAIEQANAAGIPVVVVNSAVAEGADIVTFVGADQVQYGAALADLTAMAIPDGGSVALIHGTVGNPVEVARTQGFTDRIAEVAGANVVATVTDEWKNDENLAAVQDLLTKYGPGELDVIVAEGPQIYVGAEYARSIGRDDVKFIGGDLPVQVKEAIESGAMFGTVLQDGAQQGIEGLNALCNWVTGQQDLVKRPTDFVELPLVTKDNVEQYETGWNA